MCERAARLCRAGAHRLLREPPPQGRALGGLLRWVGARMGEPRAPLVPDAPGVPAAPAADPGPGPGPAALRGGTAVILDVSRTPPAPDAPFSPRGTPAQPSARPSASQSANSRPPPVSRVPLPGPRRPPPRPLPRLPRIRAVPEQGRGAAGTPPPGFPPAGPSPAAPRSLRPVSLPRVLLWRSPGPQLRLRALLLSSRQLLGPQRLLESGAPSPRPSSGSPSTAPERGPRGLPHRLALCPLGVSQTHPSPTHPGAPPSEWEEAQGGGALRGWQRRGWTGAWVHPAWVWGGAWRFPRWASGVRGLFLLSLHSWNPGRSRWRGPGRAGQGKPQCEEPTHRSTGGCPLTRSWWPQDPAGWGCGRAGSLLSLICQGGDDRGRGARQGLEPAVTQATRGPRPDSGMPRFSAARTKMMTGSCPWRSSSSSLPTACWTSGSWSRCFTPSTPTAPTTWTPRSCVITSWSTWGTTRTSWPRWRP